ncbi:hypothetical protein OG906_29880 [Streptomyces sp. NBC_01426]|uniref:hypothetical protein n=1 Tax=unclassified Streptomyces TaxID=2593676 RepID=UPI002E3063E5|nr:hypothetical protein [Streptomyces sp. NBC_01426]
MDHEAWLREMGGRDRAPQRPAVGPEGVTQIHEPGALPFEEEQPGRQQCWDRIPAATTATLLEKAGKVLTWWAYPEPNGHPRALVIGERGICRVAPVIRAGVPEYRGERVRLEPGSLRRRSFDHRPPKVGRPKTPAPAAPPPPGVPVERLDLAPEARGILGQFPLEVQDFLQRPFLSGADRQVSADWYYDETRDGRRATLFIALCLQTERALAVVEATRTLARGARVDQASWPAIECHQARLLPR